VLALFGGVGLRPEDILGAPEEALRGAGLSGAKLAALKDLAAKTADGTVPTLARLRGMADEEIVERLTQVRGIGRWTVEMLLMFRLGRPDVLPVGDFAVRKGFALAYGLDESPKPKELLEYGERWRPYRSVASWYMWRAAELPAGGV
jgi:DNA-3-methyladenine glycosylase II